MAQWWHSLGHSHSAMCPALSQRKSAARSAREHSVTSYSYASGFLLTLGLCCSTLPHLYETAFGQADFHQPQAVNEPLQLLLTIDFCV